MATQFQQRLIGTVILVAIGVIFLPDLLSGKKQLVPDEAVTIPLRPELDAPLPAIAPPPRPGTEAAGRAAEAAAQVAAAAEQLAAQQEPEPAAEVWTIEQAQEAQPVAPKAVPQSAQTAPPKPEPKAPAPVAEKPASAQQKLVAGQVQHIEPKAPASGGAAPKAEPKPSAPAPAQGQFVIQLGAFKNAANVNALVQKLKAAGYSAQTTPSPAREGEINRVWIGPDSKDRLEQQLPALQRLTGLSGSVRAK